MASIWSFLLQCFSILFTTKSHPLKKYRDELVEKHGVQTLHKSLIPTGANKRRLILIGDVHGCLEELKLLLIRCKFSPKTDHVVFVGDLVAKGPFSLETITFVDELGEAASCVRGNHDDKLMQWNAYLSQKSNTDDYDEDHLPDGLSRRDEHRFLAKNLERDQVEFLESLPYILRIPMPHQEYLVVHAGLLPGKKLHRQKAWDVTNMRNIHKKKAIDHRETGSGWFKKWEEEQHKLIKHKRQVVIYGHDAGRDLNIRKYSKGLDSRCVRGGELTALVLSGKGIETFVHVKANRRYD